MAAAKHRFCSLSKPLGRFILHLDAVAETLYKIAAMKGTEAAQWATDWMDGCTSTSVLTLAMCADIGAAAVDLTRFFDSEEMDIAEINSEVAVFMQSLQACHVVASLSIILLILSILNCSAIFLWRFCLLTSNAGTCMTTRSIVLKCCAVGNFFSSTMVWLSGSEGAIWKVPRGLPCSTCGK